MIGIVCARIPPVNFCSVNWANGLSEVIMKKIFVLSALAALICLGCDESASHGQQSGSNGNHENECDNSGRCDVPGGSSQHGTGSGDGTGTGDGTGSGDGTGNSNEEEIVDAPTGCTTAGSAGVGESCVNNCDCASKVCVESTCKGVNVDSPAGSSNWTGNGSLSSGEKCSSDNQCLSGLCYDHKCSDNCEQYGCHVADTVCRSNKCIPTATDGGKCNPDNYKTVCRVGEFCCNGFCVSGKCEPGVSCGDYLNNDSLDICDAKCVIMPGWDGAGVCGCQNLNGCGDSMYCSTWNTASYDPNMPNICLNKKRNNSSCKENAECISGVCYSSHCSEPVGLGERCSEDAECAKGLFCPESTYDQIEVTKYCTTKLNNGAGCRRPGWCKSGFCGEGDYWSRECKPAP